MSTRPWGVSLFALVLLWGTAADIYAQRGVETDRCELLIEGRVERLFASPDGTQLVEVLLRAVQLKDLDSPVVGLRIPTPGQACYVVVGTDDNSTGRLGSRSSRVPAAGDSVRAIVRVGDRGEWRGEGKWFELASDADSGRGRFDVTERVVDVLGMSCEATRIDGKLGLEVKRVDEASPAKEAGFQPGDIVVAIDGRPITSAADLSAASWRKTEINLTVIDINTGRAAIVKVAGPGKPPVTSGSPSDAPTSPAENPEVRIARALGISVEPTRAGLRRAIKVNEVDPGSPGADAGLEPGDVIVKVGGQNVASVADFSEALPNRPGMLTLVVRDVRTGNEVPIQAKVEGLRGGESQPANGAGGMAGQLGITGELAFYNAEAAVRVVRVAPGSAADRAGVQAGMILVSADGQPLLHPDDLAKLEAKGRGRTTLRIVNPSTKREESIVISL